MSEDTQNKYFLISVQLAKENIRLGPSAVQKVEHLLSEYAKRGAGKFLLELWTGYAAELPMLKGKKHLDSRDTVSIVVKERYADRVKANAEIRE